MSNLINQDLAVLGRRAGDLRSGERHRREDACRRQEDRGSLRLVGAEPAERAGHGELIPGRGEADPAGLFGVYENLGIAYGTVTKEGLAALRADPAVGEVRGAPQLSPIRPERVASARLTRRYTWGMGALRVPQLWKQGLSGDGVLVGHLDTGVDGRHPALKGALAGFAEFDELAASSSGPRLRRTTPTTTALTPPPRSPVGRSAASTWASPPGPSWRARS